MRGLGFFLGEIGSSEATVLRTRLRDIRSPNQYKLLEDCEAKQRVINHESSKKIIKNT